MEAYVLFLCCIQSISSLLIPMMNESKNGNYCMPIDHKFSNYIIVIEVLCINILFFIVVIVIVIIVKDFT